MFFSLLLYLFASLALADTKRIAVLEFRTVSTSIPNEVIFFLGDAARQGVREGLPVQRYQVTGRENIQQILEDMGKTLEDCSTECEITLGRDIGADFVIAGSLIQLGSKYVVTLKLYNTASGSLLDQKNLTHEDTYELGTQTTAIAKDMVMMSILQSGTELSGEEVDFSFTSIPYGTDVTVQVGGNLVCNKTPCTTKVPAGKQEVVFQHKKYFTWKESVQITDKGNLDAKMKPRFALLTVETEPNNINPLLNKKPMSRNRRALEKKPGTYKLTHNDPCFISEGLAITLKAGDERSFTLSPKPKRSGIHVEVYQDGNALPAKVMIDGELKGTAPYADWLPLCSETLVVSHNGKEKTIKLNLKEHETSTMKIDL